MRIIFLNRFYWPETPATAQLLTDLAEGLARAGHTVTVIASRGGQHSLAARETNAAVSILRVRGTRCPGGLGLPGKAIDFGTFYLGALWRLATTARRGDVVIALTDPPLIGIGAGVIAQLRGAAIVHWVQDIYPELAISLAGQSWLRVLRPFRNRSWRRAGACVTLGTDMAATLAQAGVTAARQIVIPNWPPAGLAPATEEAIARVRAEWGVTNQFVVGYSGNLGRVHDLHSIVALAELFRADPGIAFVIVGHGPQRAGLEAEVRIRALANVTFQAAQPRDALAASLAAADVQLVTLLSGCESFVFPSKLYGIAAVGRPVVFIGPADCEVARVVREHGFGLTADRAALLVPGIEQLRRDADQRRRLGAAAARFAAAHAAAHGLARWRTVLEGLDACGSEPSPARTSSAS